MYMYMYVMMHQALDVHVHVRHDAPGARCTYMYIYSDQMRKDGISDP